MATDLTERLRLVGAQIISRRLSLGMKTKIRLADETGLSTRVLGDIESGKRRAGSVTYIQIEQALKWPAGSIDDYLDGYGSILADEIASTNEPVSGGAWNFGKNTRPTIAEGDIGVTTDSGEIVSLSDLSPDEREKVHEYVELLRRAGRIGGSDYDRRTADQNAAGEENQDPGGHE